MDSCCYIPSCQAPKDVASRGPEWAMLIPYGKPPGMLDRGPRFLSLVDERGGRGRQVAKSHLSALIVGWRSDSHKSFSGLVLFRLLASPLQPGVVGPFPGMGCMIHQSFVICRLRKPIVSRILSCNPRPAVPRIHYPDRNPGQAFPHPSKIATDLILCIADDPHKIMLS
jgi:hypothetical protein